MAKTKWTSLSTQMETYKTSLNWEGQELTQTGTQELC